MTCDCLVCGCLVSTLADQDMALTFSLLRAGHVSDVCRGARQARDQAHILQLEGCIRHILCSAADSDRGGGGPRLDGVPESPGEGSAAVQDDRYRRKRRNAPPPPYHCSIFSSSVPHSHIRFFPFPILLSSTCLYNFAPFLSLPLFSVSSRVSLWRPCSFLLQRGMEREEQTSILIN